MGILIRRIELSSVHNQLTPVEQSNITAAYNILIKYKTLNIQYMHVFIKIFWDFQQDENEFLLLYSNPESRAQSIHISYPCIYSQAFVSDPPLKPWYRMHIVL